MESQYASTMRYYESVYERFLSKLPHESGDPAKLTNKSSMTREKHGYVWKAEDIQIMREMRLQGISFRKIGQRFNMSGCVIQRLARIHKMASPTGITYNVIADHG